MKDTSPSHMAAVARARKPEVIAATVAAMRRAHDAKTPEQRTEAARKAANARWNKA